MFCNKCESKAYEDSVFCHRCGALLIRDDKSAAIPDFEPTSDMKNSAKFDTDFSEIAPEIDTANNAKFDIVLVEVASLETGADEDLSEKARMAVAYVLFEDMIKEVNRDPEPDFRLKHQLQSESMKNADILISNLPAPIKRSVSKSEALFFKERLAQYGVTVILGYCPNCGGSLDDISDKCITCGHAAIEFEVSDDKEIIPDTHMPKAPVQYTAVDHAVTVQKPKETDALQAPAPLLPNVRENANEKKKKIAIIILASAVTALIITAVVIWYIF